MERKYRQASQTTKAKISEGQKRRYANMTAEQRAKKNKNISEAMRRYWTTIPDKPEGMPQFDLADYRERTYNRLVNTLGMSHEQANFVIAYAKNIHEDGLETALKSINTFILGIGI